MRYALLLALVAVGMTGCRFKGYESFQSATQDPKTLAPVPDQIKGDPYADGGVADASGGLNAATRYGRGARQNAGVLPGYDSPAKGSGQKAGELPNVAKPGHAQTNAPSFQPSASDVGN